MGPAAPGKLHWFHLKHGLLLLAGEGLVGVAMWLKEVCESTSAWNCKRRARAAAVTQLLAAALHVPAQHYCRTAKGKDPVLGIETCSTVKCLATAALFSTSKEKILYIELV